MWIAVASFCRNALFLHFFTSAAFALLLPLFLDNLLNAFDFMWPLLSKALKIKVLYEDWQRRFPELLLVICDFAELLWVHAELSGHLDVGMGNMVPTFCEH